MKDMYRVFDDCDEVYYRYRFVGDWSKTWRRPHDEVLSVRDFVWSQLTDRIRRRRR
jgi:hypothetical protein